MFSPTRQPPFALLLALAWAVIAAQLLFQHWGHTAQTLNDTDDAMRLVEMRDFLAGQSWFDMHQGRVQPPIGLDSHWSRLIDAGLAGLFVLFHTVVDATLAERLMRAFWPILWLVPALIGTAAIAWRVAGREAALVTLLLAALDLPIHGVLEQDRAEHALAGERRIGDDPGAHGVHGVEHLGVAGPRVLGHAVLGERLRGAAAALVERGEEPTAGADLLELRGGHRCRMGGMTPHGNLLGPEPTLLPEDPAGALLDGGVEPAEVAATHPTSSLAWAVLAESALQDGVVITGYAYARTGYHRGLDQLRRNGWKGFGPVPWAHRPNQGFLRALAVLGKAAGKIGETEEHERCRKFLADSDPAAAEATGLK